MVGPLYARAAGKRLGASVLELPAGEETKTWVSVERVVRWLIGQGVERGDLLLAIGGGVVTDLVGFVAAITLRGLAWVAIPTTLLAMVDAAIGGKTGIDLDEGKNLLGCFWHPVAVVGDPSVLATLPARHLRAGLVEVVKAAVIAPEALEHHLGASLPALARGGLHGAVDLIAAAARVKAGVVAVDERETGPRAALNLGHTLGHALEAATSYRRFLHGEAVAWGLLAALRLAQNRGLLSREQAGAWARHLERLSPLPPIADLRWPLVSPFVSRDKKRTGREVAWVLPRAGGVAVGIPLRDAEVELVYRELATLPSAGPFDALF